MNIKTTLIVTILLIANNIYAQISEEFIGYKETIDSVCKRKNGRYKQNPECLAMMMEYHDKLLSEIPKDTNLVRKAKLYYDLGKIREIAPKLEIKKNYYVSSIKTILKYRKENRVMQSETLTLYDNVISAMMGEIRDKHESEFERIVASFTPSTCFQGDIDNWIKGLEKKTHLLFRYEYYKEAEEYLAYNLRYNPFWGIVLGVNSRFIEYYGLAVKLNYPQEKIDELLVNINDKLFVDNNKTAVFFYFGNHLLCGWDYDSLKWDYHRSNDGGQISDAKLLETAARQFKYSKFYKILQPNK